MNNKNLLGQLVGKEVVIKEYFRNSDRFGSDYTGMVTKFDSDSNTITLKDCGVFGLNFLESPIYTIADAQTRNLYYQNESASKPLSKKDLDKLLLTGTLFTENFDARDN